MMDFKRLTLRFFSFLFLFILLSVFACASPSWFPIKWGSSPKEKAKAKELADTEVVIIDQEEYVKVYNPAASGEGNQPKYLYVPVKEYLAKKEKYSSLSYRREEPKKEPSSPVQPSLSSPGVGDQIAIVSQKPSLFRIKEKGGHHLF